MKTSKTASNRYETRRQAVLRQLAEVGPFVEGALCQVKRAGCKEPGWHLTFKVKGKTRTVYVPVDLAEEVTKWTREYKRLKKLIRKVTTHSLGVIHTHVASRQAANRGRVFIRG